MYSRNYSRRGGGRWNGGDQGAGSDRESTRPARPTDSEPKPVPPPAYSGTLYISARNSDAEKDKKRKSEPAVTARRRDVNMTSERPGDVRTVRYNGEPYFPDQTGFPVRDGSFSPGEGSFREDNYGKGGHPDLGGGDSLRFHRGPRGPIVGDRTDIDYYGAPRATSASPLGALLPFDISPEDIILIALIITLISARASGDEGDDLLIIILGILLLSGRRED